MVGRYCFMMTPFGTYTTPNRLIGLPAVFATAVNAGIMPSSSGKASVAPRPRNTVRRGIAFFVMIIAPDSLSLNGRILCNVCFGRAARSNAHGKRRALHNAQHERRPSVVLRGRFSRDFADGRHVMVIEA